MAPGATVALNGGTTTSEVAQALATRPDLQNGTGVPAITVVTNAMNIANELAVRQHIKIVVTGGVTRDQSYELIGPYASLVLAELTLDWAILGVDGLDVQAGATAHHEGEASINNLMVTRAKQVMVVADSSKLAARVARMCGWTRSTSSSRPGCRPRLTGRLHRTRYPRRHRLTEHDGSRRSRCRPENPPPFLDNELTRSLRCIFVIYNARIGRDFNHEHAKL